MSKSCILQSGRHAIKVFNKRSQPGSRCNSKDGQTCKRQQTTNTEGQQGQSALWVNRYKSLWPFHRTGSHLVAAESTRASTDVSDAGCKAELPWECIQANSQLMSTPKLGRTPFAFSPIPFANPRVKCVDLLKYSVCDQLCGTLQN